jgi:hypothetical protein
MEYHKNMCELFARTSPNEVVVGWYSTGTSVSMNSAIFHTFYDELVGDNSPIHLIVDTQLNRDTPQIRAFINTTTFSVGDSNLAAQFLPGLLHAAFLHFALCCAR